MAGEATPKGELVDMEAWLRKRADSLSSHGHLVLGRIIYTRIVERKRVLTEEQKRKIAESLITVSDLPET
jgi:hypothetical protein